MDSSEFVKIRKKLGRTQKQMGELLGVSIKAIHSYEQRWRSIPASVERQILFLFFRLETGEIGRKDCWDIKNCPAERKTRCPAWEFQAGELCWFINGTICEGKPQKNWDEKMRICRACEAFRDHGREK
ncbi:MAG: transcriptional regulator [Deltaproteobacteria bacterium]|nr:transcriptional regulator [Deltaproteobacteria bacterium]